MSKEPAKISMEASKGEGSKIEFSSEVKNYTDQEIRELLGDQATGLELKTASGEHSNNWLKNGY